MITYAIYPLTSTLGIMSNLFPLSKSKCWVSPFEFLIENHGDPHVFRIFLGGKTWKKPGKTQVPHALPMPKATFLPSAEDEDLQRELAALQRCDAILAISRHEERLLVETYGLPRWKAALGEVMSTLWLCQNSYWKWPFIVDLPIKNGDFPWLC